MQTSLTFFLFVALTFLLGCSESSDSKNKTGVFVERGVGEPGTHHPGGPAEDEVNPAENAEGSYAVELRMLNSAVTEGQSGSATLVVDGDHFSVEVKMEGLEGYSSHAQYIHTSTSCPEIAQDMNADEFIDQEEGSASYGKILIPLDGDISAQMLDSNVFPAANGTGRYVYTNATSLSLLLSDLKLEDMNPEDDYAKLAVGERLDIEGRTLVIYGAPAGSKLPTTVKAFKGMTKESSLPIACGKIARVAEEVR